MRKLRNSLARAACLCRVFLFMPETGCPVGPGGEEHGGFGYAWSKSDLDIPRSLLIWWRVPVARSRLPCLGMIALRPLAGFTHISWDPSAWRRNLQPIGLAPESATQGL